MSHPGRAVAERIGRVGVWTFAFDRMHVADARRAAGRIEDLGVHVHTGMATTEMTYLRMRFELLENHLCACAAYDVRVRGQLVFRTSNEDMRVFKKRGMYEAQMRIHPHFFNEMTYSVFPTLTVAREGEGRRQYVLMIDPLSFIAYSPEATLADKGGEKSARAAGFVAPVFRWRFDRLDSPKEPQPAAQPEEPETDVTRA